MDDYQDKLIKRLLSAPDEEVLIIRGVIKEIHSMRTLLKQHISEAGRALEEMRNGNS